jgi:AcrR family transcriptional regulator
MITSSSANMAIRDEVAALKRARTVGAAVDLFYDHGYDGTTLEAVAERLGVTKPFIYAHFSSKAQLLADICSSAISASLEAIDTVLTTNAGPRRKLEQLVRLFVSAVLRNQKEIAIYTREEKSLALEDHERISKLRRDFDHKLAALLAEGTKKGDFSLSDPRLAALSIGGMVSWSYVWFRPDGRLTPEQTADEICKLVLAMVQAKPQRG